MHKDWKRPRDPKKSLPDVTARLTEAARHADSLVLFRGLPHDKSESFAPFRDSSRSLLLNGYLFYPDPIVATDDQLRKLSDVLCDADTLHPWDGPSDCGGFHPDFALEWRVGGERYRILVCFGCGEAEIFGPQVESRNLLREAPVIDALAELPVAVFEGIAWRHPEYLAPAELQTTQPDAAAKATAGAADSPYLLVYEGLPHHNFDRDSLNAELKRKDIVDFNQHPYYREPLDISPRDRKRLQEIFSTPQAFVPFTGEADCGGFHPDYALEWRSNEGRVRVHLCLGCEEAKIFGPGIRSRHVLTNRDGEESELERILRKYKKHRPTFVN